MVKKLLKHETIYYYRTLGILLPIVLVFGIMTRVFRLFENGNVLTDIAIGSSVTMFVISCFALLILATVISVVRFYKNMYSAEGYLTFTLPVTQRQHIFVKLLVASIAQALCTLVVILALIIAFSGESLLDAVRWTFGSLGDLVTVCGVGNFIFFALELLILLLLAVPSQMLVYYACITLGQTAKKNRILMSVAAYFVYYMITQLLGTFFTMAVMIVATSGIGDLLAEWTINHPMPAIHIIAWGSILLSVAFTVALWFITESVMKKKLNLE